MADDLGGSGSQFKALGGSFRAKTLGTADAPSLNTATSTSPLPLVVLPHSGLAAGDFLMGVHLNKMRKDGQLWVDVHRKQQFGKYVFRIKENRRYRFGIRISRAPSTEEVVPPFDFPGLGAMSLVSAGAVDGASLESGTSGQVRTDGPFELTDISLAESGDDHSLFHVEFDATALGCASLSRPTPKGQLVEAVFELYFRDANGFRPLLVAFPLFLRVQPEGKFLVNHNESHPPLPAWAKADVGKLHAASWMAVRKPDRP